MNGPLGTVTGTVTGDLTARFLPDGSVAGVARGSYDGGTVADVCVCGTWLANVIRDAAGQYRLEGSWTHPQAAGTHEGRGGGPVLWYINTSTNPISASGNFTGLVTFAVSPFPLTVGGTWTATVPLDP
jgi:hypothetical protein